MIKLDIPTIAEKWRDENFKHQFVSPICEEIFVKPLSKNNITSIRLEEYREEIRRKVQKEVQDKGYKKIKKDFGCYLYIIFRRKRINGKFPDVDNLPHSFSYAIKFDAEKDIKDETDDTIKNGILLEDEKQIIGIKSNLVEIPEDKKESISFTLIPTYNLEIHCVKSISGEYMDKLNKLREAYLARSLEEAGLPPWRRPMQMVETNYGTFFDNTQGILTNVKNHGDKFLHKPEPGFDWKPKEGKEVNGIMLFERSGCWWINKWAE